MRKNALVLLVAISALVSCSKKTHPATSNPPTTSPVITPPPPIGSSPMIVIDEKGRIITSRDNLPDNIASKVDYKKITRSFTPAQRQNLIYRFKMVPPRVLFVPDKLVSKTARGYYCVYKKKFWYWKKEDGLFYLDETYYQ